MRTFKGLMLSLLLLASAAHADSIKIEVDAQFSSFWFSSSPTDTGLDPFLGSNFTATFIIPLTGTPTSDNGNRTFYQNLAGLSFSFDGANTLLDVATIDTPDWTDMQVTHCSDYLNNITADCGPGIGRQYAGPAIQTGGFVYDLTFSSGMLSGWLTDGTLPDYETYTSNLIDVTAFTICDDGYNDCISTYENGSIQSSLQISVIPVPAAVWLFGSALAGLGWVRRKQTV